MDVQMAVHLVILWIFSLSLSPSSSSGRLRTQDPGDPYEVSLYKPAPNSSQLVVQLAVNLPLISNPTHLTTIWTPLDYLGMLNQDPIILRHWLPISVSRNTVYLKYKIAARDTVTGVAYWYFKSRISNTKRMWAFKGARSLEASVNILLSYDRVHRFNPIGIQVIHLGWSWGSDIWSNLSQHWTTIHPSTLL